MSNGYYSGRTLFQEKDELPTDRKLLMNARAEGRNAEVLTAYQKKVRSLEALERKLQRQLDALEAAKEGTDCHTVGRHAHMPPEDGGAIKGSLPTVRLARSEMGIILFRYNL